jgi:signal transduction histidine kinase
LEVLPDNIQDSNRCIRDLVALSALPAIWVGGSNPKRIAEDLADALFTALRPSFIYTGLEDPSADRFAFEAVRSQNRLPADVTPHQIGKTLRHSLKLDPAEKPLLIPNPAGGGMLRMLAIPIGHHGKWGIIAAGSPSPDFPSELDRLLLRTGANQAAVAVENACLYRAAKEELAERKRAEEERRTVLSQFETVLRQMPAGVVIAEAPSGKLILGNEQADKIWRHPFVAADNIGEYRKYEGFHLDGTPYRPEEWPLARAIMKGEVVTGEEIDFIGGDGMPGTMVANAAPIRNREGAIIMAVVTFYDITDRKKAEAALKQKTLEAEEASRLKSRFVSQVSHDLRTPLNAIMGYNHLLSAEIYGPLAEDQKITLERMQKNAEHLLTLINDVLDLSKIESGKESIDLVPVDIARLIEEILAEMKPLSNEKSLSIQYRSPRTPIVIESDATKVKQILTNLVSNAIKFTDQGSISVEAGDQSEKGGVEITVHDTGIGIREEELSRIFESFYQGEDVAARSSQGSGLGLAIVKELVDLLQGEIAVESRHGQGSTFTLFLPYRLNKKP